MHRKVFMSTEVRLAIIMPVFGNWDDTLDCLGMLSKQTNMNFQLYLADDGSLQPPPDAVYAFSFVTYVHLSHAGFATTCNRAVDIASEAGYTHVLLLNNDTSFGPSFVEGWLSKIVPFPQAIMGPMIFYYERPDAVWYSGGNRSILVPFVRFLRRFERQTAVDILTGCVLLVPVQTWISLNGFDERYVTYYEDFDFMLRARDEGVPAYLVVEPELWVLHKVSRTSLNHGRWNRDYRMLASRLLFIRRRYFGIEKVACLFISIPHLVFLTFTNLPELPDPRQLYLALKNGLKSDASAKPIRKAVQT
jgi:hypothetical protein